MTRDKVRKERRIDKTQERGRVRPRALPLIHKAFIAPPVCPALGREGSSKQVRFIFLELTDKKIYTDK